MNSLLVVECSKIANAKDLELLLAKLKGDDTNELLKAVTAP